MKSYSNKVVTSHTLNIILCKRSHCFDTNEEFLSCIIELSLVDLPGSKKGKDPTDRIGRQLVKHTINRKQFIKYSTSTDNSINLP